MALKTALALFQLGEFGLVVFELAGAKDLIDPTTSQILIVTIAISMILTPFVLRHISSLADLILRESENVETAVPIQHTMQDHIIILGYGRLGRKIAQKLENRAVSHIAVDNNIHNVQEGQKNGKAVIFGNAANKSILESLNIKDAAVVIVALDNAERLHLICDVLSKVATKAKVVIKVDRFAEQDILHEEFPAYEILVGTEQMARGMVDSVLKCKMA